MTETNARGTALRIKAQLQAGRLNDALQISIHVFENILSIVGRKGHCNAAAGGKMRGQEGSGSGQHPSLTFIHCMVIYAVDSELSLNPYPQLFPMCRNTIRNDVAGLEKVATEKRFGEGNFAGNSLRVVLSGGHEKTVCSVPAATRQYERFLSNVDLNLLLRVRGSMLYLVDVSSGN